MNHYIETKKGNKLIRRVDVTKASSKTIKLLRKYLHTMFPTSITYSVVSNKTLDFDYAEDN